MKPLEIESWALRILERAEKHLPIEDARVEVKAQWPEANKTARQLAGHANAARGENLLWLIGVDEKKGIVGANYQELSSWFPGVQSGFESTAPSLEHINVNYGTHTVAALCFDTSRAPYVVKNPACGSQAAGPVEYEVPWREGTRTRSATRSDLVTLLSPLIRVPKIEILAGEVRRVNPQRAGDPPDFHFNLTTYVTPLNEDAITFPLHKCSAGLKAGLRAVAGSTPVVMDTPGSKADKQKQKWANTGHITGSNVYLPPAPQVNVRTGTDPIEVTRDEIVIRGAGKLLIEGSFGTLASVEDICEVELGVILTEAVAEMKVTLLVNLRRQKTEGDALVWASGPSTS